MAEPTPQESYDRGHAAGEVAGSVAEQLRRHDNHFVRINGSVDHVALEVAGLRADLASEREVTRLAIQKIEDLMMANAGTVTATAQALAFAEETRRRQAETTWSPVAKAIAIVGAVAALFGAWLAWRSSR